MKPQRAPHQIKVAMFEISIAVIFLWPIGRTGSNVRVRLFKVMIWVSFVEINKYKTNKKRITFISRQIKSSNSVISAPVEMYFFKKK